MLRQLSALQPLKASLKTLASSRAIVAMGIRCYAGAGVLAAREGGKSYMRSERADSAASTAPLQWTHERRNLFCRRGAAVPRLGEAANERGISLGIAGGAIGRRR